MNKQLEKPEIIKNSIPVDQQYLLVALAENAARMIVKHMAAGGHDMAVNWRADFRKMKLDITVEHGLISTSLLKSFLDGIHQRDDRFEKTKIIGALQITSEFKVTLSLNPTLKFDVRAYQPEYPDNAGVELDLVLQV